MPHAATARQPLCADVDGFSLHIGVRVEGHDRRATRTTGPPHHTAGGV